jgi:small subunit ribosomal protein S4
MVRRPYAPGGKGALRRPKKLSDYALRLNEKQKARHFYGMGERQFRSFFEKAYREKGMSGENLLRKLENRIDNFVYRVGLAKSRRQARQAVLHGHFQVNNHAVDIPSYVLKINDKVKIKPSSLGLFKDALELISRKKQAPWYSFDMAQKEAQLLAHPERKEIDVPVNEQLIVEFYSR